MTRVVTVTGACGFIGRHVVEALLTRGDYVYAVDALTYAADPSVLDDWARTFKPSQIKFMQANICDLSTLPDVDVIINLAAETHVDSSIKDSKRFVETNILGVHHLLELVRAKRGYDMPHFIQISTDEVYGDIQHGDSTETAPLAPSSPYAASKAAADHLVAAWARTYGLHYNIVRPSNCYGRHQYPEKLIPKAIRYLALGKRIPIHEDGSAARSWLAVEDCVSAILTIVDRGALDTIYNVPGNTEMSVRGVASLIVEAFHGPNTEPANFFALQYTRQGLDRRYHVDGSRLRGLGWTPTGDLRRDLPRIVEAERETLRW